MATWIVVTTRYRPLKIRQSIGSEGAIWTNGSGKRAKAALRKLTSSMSRRRSELVARAVSLGRRPMTLIRLAKPARAIAISAIVRRVSPGST
jgi:hypothetical protein